VAVVLASALALAVVDAAPVGPALIVIDYIDYTVTGSGGYGARQASYGARQAEGTAPNVGPLMRGTTGSTGTPGGGMPPLGPTLVMGPTTWCGPGTLCGGSRRTSVAPCTGSPPPTA
jgi:hypothetical protein